MKHNLVHSHADFSAESGHLEANFLGPPQIYLAGQDLIPALSGKAIGLLAYLMLGPSHGYPRDHLASLFWAETGEERAHYNLRRTIWSLRKTINPEDAPLHFYILYRDGYYAFNLAAAHWLDVRHFQLATEALSSQVTPNGSISRSIAGMTETARLLEQARNLYRGDFLQGCHPPACEPFLDWLFVQRNQLQQDYIQILRTLAGHYTRDRRYTEAITCCEEILALDPLQEAVCRDLMFIYYQTGRRDTALEHYQTLSRLLQNQLGVSPVPETENLYRDIRDGTLKLEGESYALPLARTAQPLQEFFVGREQELEKLTDALHSARQGQSKILLINGEPGIGKTRLVEEFLSAYDNNPDNEDITVLRAQCFAHDQELPYQPFIDALRGYFPFADFTYIAQLSDLWLAEVARLLPELYEYLPRLPVSAPIFPGQEKNRLFEGLAQFIAHLSQRQTVVLFLDDFHATDQSTLDLVHYLARRLGAAPVLFIGTVQPELSATRAEMRRFSQTLQRAGRLVRFSLEALSEAEARALLRHTTPQSPDLDELGRRLYSRTGGNPFFMQELLKAHRDSPEPVDQPKEVPPTVSDFILQRLSNLDAPLQEVLRLAAVCGRQFDFKVLEELYGRDQRTLMDHLAQLVGRSWLVDARNHPRRYEFSHGLVQEAVYQTLELHYRQKLHRRVGSALEKLQGMGSEHVGLLASHFWRANDMAQALPYLLEAADRARNLYANQEALLHYRRALTILADPDSPAPLDRRIQIHRRLADVYERMGRYDEAIETYTQILPLADSSRPEHRRIYFGLASVYTRKGSYDQALSYLQMISHQVSEPDDDQSWLDAIRCARSMGHVYLQREQSHQALASLVQSRALLDAAQSVTDVNTAEIYDSLLFERTAIYEGMGDCYFHLGNYQDAIDHYEQALSLSQSEEHKASIPRLHRGLSRVYRRWGTYAAAENHARESLSLAREIGDVAGEAASYGALGDVAYNRGDFEQSLSHYRKALDTFLQIGDQHRIADYYISLAFVKIDQGEIDQAHSYLEQALEIGQAIHASMVLVRANYHLAKIAFARGDLGGAESRVSHAIELAQEAGIRLLEAMGLRLLGEILSQRQQPRRAEEQLGESLRLIEGLGDQFETAWTLRVYARLLSQTDRSHARAQLERALSIFARLGAQREFSITQSELEKLADNSA
ncbi:MAG: tetratricopeptide repeat protein [Chloroflexota bacterium]